MKKLIVTIMLFGSLCTHANEPMTPLMSAAYNLGSGDYNNNVQAMVSLIHKGADITVKDSQNNTAYQWYLKGGTAHGNHFDPLVQKLLTIRGITPLMVAAYYGDSKRINALVVDQGADITVKDSQNNTAYQWYLNGPAVHEVNGLFRLYIESLLIPITPLMNAAFKLGEGDYNDNVQAMVSLIHKGADITVKDSQNNTAYQWYLKGGKVYWNQLDPFVKTLLTTPNLGITPLMVAAYQDDFKTMNALVVDQGADITVKDSQNNTAYQWYLKGGAAHGNHFDPLVQKLLTIRGITPLMIAAYNLGNGDYSNNVQALQGLIHKGADINAKDSQNNTAYQWYFAGGAAHGNQLDPRVQKLLTTH